MFTLKTFPACEESFQRGPGKVAGFSLRAGVAAWSGQRQKLERLGTFFRRSAISDERLPLKPKGNVRYQSKMPYRYGTTCVIFEPRNFNTGLAALVPKLRVNLTRFRGVLGPINKYGALVTLA